MKASKQVKLWNKLHKHDKLVIASPLTHAENVQLMADAMQRRYRQYAGYPEVLDLLDWSTLADAALLALLLPDIAAELEDYLPR